MSVQAAPTANARGGVGKGHTATEIDQREEGAGREQEPAQEAGRVARQGIPADPEHGQRQRADGGRRVAAHPHQAAEERADKQRRRRNPGGDPRSPPAVVAMAPMAANDAMASARAR